MPGEQPAIGMHHALLPADLPPLAQQGKKVSGHVRQRGVISGVAPGRIDQAALGVICSCVSLLDLGCGERRHAFELHVAVLELVFVVLLEEDGADQAGDAVLVGEDADDVGAALHLLVQRSSGLVECSLTRCCSGKVM